MANETSLCHYEMKSSKRLDDKEGLKAIKQHLKIGSVEELQRLDKQKRDSSLRKLKAAERLSVRQIARITGFTLNIVAKA